MKGTREIAGIIAGAVLVTAGLGYVYTAPYPGNTGLQRTPGVRISEGRSLPP